MTRLSKSLYRFMKDRKGASAVEFALIAPVMIMMLFGVLETGRVLYTKSTLQRGVEVAARYAMVHQTATTSELQKVAFDDLAPKGDGGTTPTIVVTTVTVGSVDFMVISAKLDHTLAIPLMSSRKLSLTAESRVPLQ